MTKKDNLLFIFSVFVHLRGTEKVNQHYYKIHGVVLQECLLTSVDPRQVTEMQTCNNAQIYSTKYKNEHTMFASI